MRPKVKKIKNTLHSLASRIRSVFTENGALCPECVPINLNRIIYCALVALPVNMANVLALWLRVPGSALEARWRMGVIYGNGGMLILMMIALFVAWRLRHTGRIRSANILQILTILSLVASAIALTAVDQLITTNITPFVLACLVVGAMFLIRPVISGLIFSINLAAFILLVGRESRADVLLSNRVNALTAAALGFALSLATWRRFVVEVRQRRQIEAQSAELERVNRELQNMAFTDSLTGLPNRRYFDQALTRELAAIERGSQSAGVIEFDLDFFKNINDSCGHAAGDEVLRQLAALVGGTIRKADMFARYGGEEFILLLPETTLEGAATAAEKLRQRIESHVFHADGQDIRITASFGVVELNTNPALSGYRAVDRALYRAKQKGRNRVETLSGEEAIALTAAVSGAADAT